MSAHDRFEILAGAVALDEATPQERVAFDAHAATCAECREDGFAGAVVVAKIARAHESETWRPSQPIVDRIRARRNGRARFTLGALGWGIGLSLVLNVAIAGGIGTRLIGAFEPHVDTASVSSTITLDAPHLSIIAPQTWQPPVVAYVAPRKIVRKAHVAVARAMPVAAKAEKLPTLDDMPDLLAGLDLYGTESKHHVAVETMPRCKAQTDTDESDVADGHPCRDANGRIEH